MVTKANAIISFVEALIFANSVELIGVPVRLGSVVLSATARAILSRKGEVGISVELKGPVSVGIETPFAAAHHADQDVIG